MIAFKERITKVIFLNSSQIGKVPITNKKDGRKIKNKHTKLVNQDYPLFKKIPKYAENVNNGPGIA